MSDIISIVAKMKSFHAGKPTQINEIESAEQELGLKFNEDYKECLRCFGQFSIYGQEFTGITKTTRLDIVKVTKDEKLKNNYVSQDLYVIEQTHFDDIVIWQNQHGEIFQSSLTTIQKIANSLLEYIGLDSV